MAYELFNKKATRVGSPKLTVTTDGKMTLNADAGDLLRRAGGKFVHILWDAEACRIALRPLAKADNLALKLTTQSGRRRGMSISAAAFLRYIHWNALKSTMVAVSWNEENKVLEATLPSKFVAL